VLCGGQAAVLHRLAITSKDGDWILREDQEALGHVLGVLASAGAHYRFGAPLDVRWMSGGWSAHLEFACAGLRVRTDFFTRPPRLAPSDVEQLWIEQEGRDPPFTGARILAEMKKTDRQKDYPFIGELARRMIDPRDRLLYSRSPDDLIELAGQHPRLAGSLVEERQLLARVGSGRRALAEALQLEMLDLIEANEKRVAAYRSAAEAWAQRWISLSRELEGVPLPRAHARILACAQGVLPEKVAT
jgi:hypothetical protein